MSIVTISVELIQKEHPELEMELLAGGGGLHKKISNSEINRPGLSLTGFFDFFAHDRIQVFGKGEWAYLNSLSEEKVFEIAEKFYSYSLNCIIFTHNNHPQKHFIRKSEELNIPLFVTKVGTHKFITIISQVLNFSLAPRTMRHGVLVEVFGIGILLCGKSGVGKSETALELIERGHRLVADDMVEIKRIAENRIIGTSSDIIRHHMEIRGLGIINVQDIFGIGAVRDSQDIELIITLEEWSPDVKYDRTGLDVEFEEIIGVRVPSLRIPIKPGRNIPIIVETAAMNQRLRYTGNNSAMEFDKRLKRYIEVRNKP
jgi:HPr kinase/phosphorylase